MDMNIPEKVKSYLGRRIDWDEVDGGDDGVPGPWGQPADRSEYYAWELKPMMEMRLVMPEQGPEKLVEQIYNKLVEIFEGYEVKGFNDWRPAYDKYGLIHLWTEVIIGSDTYYIEMISHAPNETGSFNDAVFSNTSSPLGGKYFYM